MCVLQNYTNKVCIDNWPLPGCQPFWGRELIRSVLLFVLIAHMPKKPLIQTWNKSVYSFKGRIEYGLSRGYLVTYTCVLR